MISSNSAGLCYFTILLCCREASIMTCFDWLCAICELCTVSWKREVYEHC
nr:MAG TPA: hypothetical protein [Caudoviricetes sp.]